MTWFGNCTSRGNTEWEDGYTMAERAGAYSYKNATRMAKIRIAAEGVDVEGHSDITSGDVLALIFHADRHIDEAKKGDRAIVTGLLRRGSRATGRVAVDKRALGALRRINDLH